MTTSRLLLLVLGLCACNRSQAETPPTPAKHKMPDPKPLTLELTMKTAGSQLHVDYKLVNRTKAAYWVEDVMIRPEGAAFVLTPTAMIVHAGPSANEVVFARGDVSPDSKVNIRYPPAVRMLAAGATVTGSAVVGLPLKSWISYGSLNALAGVPTQASLDVYVYPEQSPTESISLADGSQAKRIAPTSGPGTVVHADAQPLPK